MLQRVAEPIKQRVRKQPSEDSTLNLIDRRKADRLNLHLPVAYTFLLPGDLFRGTATTTNISGGGVSFFVPTMTTPQTSCQLELPLDVGQPLLLSGKVVWCRQGTGRHRKQFEIGVAFGTPERYDDETFARYSRFIAEQLLKKHYA